MYIIYFNIVKFFASRCEKWIGIYEDVLECGEFYPDSELGKLNNINQIIPTRNVIGNW